MGVFAVLTIFIVVDAINKKYYNDIKVEYEVQEEEELNNVILAFARNEGSAYSTETVKAVRNPEDETKFRIDGTVPEIQNGIVTNLDDLTSSDGREFYFFSTNSSFIDPQEDPENPDFIFSEPDSRYYVSTEDNPIWYDVPKSSENLTLYSVFLTPNVHNSDFANGPLLNTSPNVIISHDVTKIPYNGFSDLLPAMMGGEPNTAKIETVVIPNSTKNIDSCLELNYSTGEAFFGGAFALCTTLTDIVIPGSVEEIGGDAFMLCSGLDTVEYENGYYLSTENNEHAILIDTNLKATNVTIHEDCISIQGGTFSKYYFMLIGLIPLPDVEDDSKIEEILGNYININLQEIAIPKNVKNIGYAAFYLCISLENVVFEENSDLTSIGAGSFGACSSLKTINLEVTKLEELSSIFNGCSKLTSITIPESVTSIGNSAFYNCSSLTSVTISNYVTSIGERAFYSCSKLTSITIPKSVTSIGQFAFEKCTGLTSITFEDMTGLTSIGYRVFIGCDNVKELIIQSGEVKDLDFSDLSGLTTVILGDSVTSIGYSAFRHCSSLTSITILGGVTSIGVNAFSGCSSLTSITIPESVTSMGDGAFWNCSTLESINIPEGITTIGSFTFSGCSSLTSITIPSSVTSIGDYAFSYCSSLTSILIPEGVTSIESHAFENCYKLAEVYDLTGPNGLNITAGNGGNGRIGLYAVEIKKEEGVTGIYCPENNNEFVMYKDLKGNHYLVDYKGQGGNISLPTFDDARTYSIKRYAFYENLTITSIEIPRSVTSIGNSAFYGCNNLTSITIPESVTSIGSSAFEDCSSLTSIIIPESVTSIGGYAFYYCTGLTSITLENMTGLTSIGSYIFDGCDNVKELIIQSGEVKDLNFNELNGLTTVTLGDGVTSIGSSAFEGCDSLTSITIPDSVTSIGDSAFYGCSNLTIYCEVKSRPSGWSSSWNNSNRPVYWAGEWEYDEVTGEPRPIESGVESLSDIGEDFGIGFDGLGFREELYFNDKRERKVV